MMDALKSIGAAGSSAVIAVTGIHPIDVVKTRLQVSGDGGRDYKALGIGGSVRVSYLLQVNITNALYF